MAESGEVESPLMSVNSSAEIDIEGDITVPGAPDSDEEPSTLDEPISETLVRYLHTSTSTILESRANGFGFK